MSVQVHRAITGAVAAVWLYQGLWCKVVRAHTHHEAIVADVPFVGSAHARAATMTIGSGEVALAAWVISGHAPVRAAATQTALLLGMNAGGLLFARERIAAPGRMLLRNVGFLVAIWTLPALRRST